VDCWAARGNIAEDADRVGHHVRALELEEHDRPCYLGAQVRRRCADQPDRPNERTASVGLVVNREEDPRRLPVDHQLDRCQDLVESRRIELEWEIAMQFGVGGNALRTLLRGGRV
jgi:hypothetical protein